MIVILTGSIQLSERNAYHIGSCDWTRRCWQSAWQILNAHKIILKEINPEYLLEGLMLKLKLQYLGHLMWRADLLEKTLMPGKIERRRRRGRQRMSWVDGIIASMDMSLRKLGNSEGQGRLACCSPWDCRVRHYWEHEQQQDMSLVPSGAGLLPL